jgi:hypothetical protein
MLDAHVHLTLASTGRREFSNVVMELAVLVGTGHIAIARALADRVATVDAIAGAELLYFADRRAPEFFVPVASNPA